MALGPNRLQLLPTAMEIENIIYITYLNSQIILSLLSFFIIFYRHPCY
jgi:hypothetical protein